ncbi:MAG: glucan biosynthesis protein [Comamonadaceae bacterium]|nr:glucan biosynthesis protein [Comamonadaceae bacterium]
MRLACEPAHALDLPHALRRRVHCGCAFGLDDVAREAESAGALVPAPSRRHCRARWPSSGYDDYRKRPLPVPSAGALACGAALPFELQFFHVGRGVSRGALAVAWKSSTAQLRAAGDHSRRVRRRQACCRRPTTVAALIAGLRGAPIALNDAGRRWTSCSPSSAPATSARSAPGQRYGLSARAPRGRHRRRWPTARSSRRFTAFWLERPAPGAQTLTAPRAARRPARRRRLPLRRAARARRPSSTCRRGCVCARRRVATLGMAPLIEHVPARREPARSRDDYRPEVHDSDGLQIETGGGEWIWRPLTNPKPRTFVTSFASRSPAWLRAACSATARSAATKTSRPRYELPPERLGRAARRLGRRPRRAAAVPHPRRDPRQRRRLLGAGRDLPPPGRAAASWPGACTGHGDDARQPPGARVVQTRSGHGYREGGDPARAPASCTIDFAGAALDGAAGRTRRSRPSSAATTMRAR